jgi:hypothetical protein
MPFLFGQLAHLVKTAWHSEAFVLQRKERLVGTVGIELHFKSIMPMFSCVAAAPSFNWYKRYKLGFAKLRLLSP